MYKKLSLIILSLGLVACSPAKPSTTASSVASSAASTSSSATSSIKASNTKTTTTKTTESTTNTTTSTSSSTTTTSATTQAVTTTSQDPTTTTVEAAASTIDLDAILAGDYSSIAGVWANAAGDTMEITADGVIYTNGYSEPNQIFNPSLNDEGLGIQAGVQAGMYGYGISIYPVGASATYSLWSNETDTTDRTRDRISTGQALMMGPELAQRVYYRVQ